MNRKVTAYLSHSIRGSKGKDATAKDMAENCQKALEAANWVRNSVSGLDLYVPAEHEEFVQQAYEKNYLSIEQILVVDCNIVIQKDLLLVYTPDGWVGGGIEREVQCAKDRRKFVFFVQSLDELTAVSLRTLVASLLQRKEENE